MGTLSGSLRNFASEKRNIGRMETEFGSIEAKDVNKVEYAIGHGAMMLCGNGNAEIQINFDTWQLSADSFIIFYPGDIVLWKNVSGDFKAEIVRYSREVLRAASINIEHEIYRELRDDRICSNKRLIQTVVKAMFQIFRFYYGDKYTFSIDRIAALQVQSFFIGFADYMRYNPASPHAQSKDSKRNKDLFAKFMCLLEQNYLEGYAVTYYADMMNISRKYLGHIAKEHTGLTAKHIIDDYRILQLKLALSTTNLSIKEVTNNFHFTDQSALTRYFKAHTGKSPKDYRQ